MIAAALEDTQSLGRNRTQLHQHKVMMRRVVLIRAFLVNMNVIILNSHNAFNLTLFIIKTVLRRGWSIFNYVKLNADKVRFWLIL